MGLRVIVRSFYNKILRDRIMLKYTLLIFFILFQSPLLFAGEQTKIVLHMNDNYKLGHLLNSVENIRDELGNETEIKVVINGKAVQAMLKNNKISTDIVTSILQKNVDIGLCHNAVRSSHVDKSMLIDGLDILPQDGNVTIFKLKQKGYAYIKM